MEDKQQRNLRNYHHQARLLLTERERDHLHDLLKEYQTYHNARQFVLDLRSLLNTPAKLDLLREIRNLVPPAYLSEFDSLAPYDHMAHPLTPHIFTDMSSVFKRSPSWHGRGLERALDTQSEDLDMHRTVGTETRVLTLTNKSEDLGFTIKGGSEQGTPISVSRVERGSDAERNGLLVGDEILEVNNISFEEIAVSSAIRVLQGSSRLRMTVQHNPALAQNSHRRQSKEKTKWFDTYSRSRGAPAGLNLSPPGAGKERKVVIQLDDKHRYIGFNIRGGSEYGLGIFVSKTDPGGMAEHHRIKVGDQILTVNGTSCESISHASAVDLIRGQKRLVLTIRSMGPDTLDQSQTRTQRSQNMAAPAHRQQLSPPFPNGPVPPIPKQNKDWLTRAQPHGGVQVQRLDGRDLRAKQSPVDNTGNLLSSRLNQGQSVSPTGDVPSRPSSAQSQQSTQRLRTQPLSYPQLHSQPHAQPHPQPNPQPHPQPNPQSHHQPHPQTQPQVVTARGESGGKEKRRALGRSLSVKHPGERRLPVMEQPKTKGVKVRRNKTFRELFGLKPKVKSREKGHMDQEILPRDPGGGGKEPMEREVEVVLAEAFGEDLARVDPIGQEAGAHEEGLLASPGDKEGKKNKKGKTKKTGGIIASFRKTRPEGVVKKRISSPLPLGEEGDPDRPLSPERPDSATSWASRKDSAGDSHSISSHGSLGKNKGAFLSGLGTQVMHVEAAQSSQMALLTETAKKILDDDESAAVMRHIKRYHMESDVDSMVTPLLAILDRPEKLLLLREVRGVIAPLDLAVFDTMVSRRELEARNIVNAKSGSVSPRLTRDRKQMVDQTDSVVEDATNNNGRDNAKQKRHLNELERLKREREEEVRQARLNSSDPSSLYSRLGVPANQARHGSFDTYTAGERSDATPPAPLLSFKGGVGVKGGSVGGGSSTDGTPEGSLSKRSAKKVLINSAPHIIKTNSPGDDGELSPRSDDGYGGHLETNGGRGSAYGDKNSGWDPYETIPNLKFNGRSAEHGSDSPKILNNEFQDRGRSNRPMGPSGNSRREYESPYETIKVNPLLDDSVDAHESDRESVDSDYNLRTKSGAYSREDEGAHLSPTKPRQLSPIPASPPTPRVIQATPPSSPTGAAASQNLDALLMGGRGQPIPRDQPSQQQGRREGSNSNGSSSSSSLDEPLYAKVNKDGMGGATPANFLDIPGDSLDSASESEGGTKRVSFSDYRGSPVAPRKGILKNSFNGSERPTVPIRNPQLYLDDDDDDEPSPLKEVMRRTQGRSPVKPVARRRIDGFPGREIFEFELSKSQSSLGLSLTGGKDYKNQPYVKVDRIYPGGAVAEDGTLTSGCVLVGVDGESLLDVSHHQAMDIIRSAYSDHGRKTMQIEFMDAI